MSLDELIPKEKLSDQVYNALSKAILSNDLAPGKRLSVPELARQMSVSRSPVREAILRLEGEGLVHSVPHHGAVVASGDIHDLRELYEAREALEGYISRLAAQNTPAQLAELRRLLNAHRQAVSDSGVEGLIDSDLGFHRVVRDMANNTRLKDLHSMLEAQIRVALYSTVSQPGNPEMAIEEHEALLAALESGDPDLAEDLARSHVRRVWGTLLEVLADRERAD